MTDRQWLVPIVHLTLWVKWAKNLDEREVIPSTPEILPLILHDDEIFISETITGSDLKGMSCCHSNTIPITCNIILSSYFDCITWSCQLMDTSLAYWVWAYTNVLKIHNSNRNRYMKLKKYIIQIEIQLWSSKNK